MPHGHDGSNEERLVANFRHEDDAEGSDEGVHETFARLRVRRVRAIARSLETTG